MGTNQDAPPPLAPATGPFAPDDALAHESVAAEAERRRAADAVGGAVRAGLVRWTAIVVVGAVTAVLLGRVDLALFLAIAALFALAQSWDRRDRARTGDPLADLALEPGLVGTALRLLVPMVVPASGALLYAGLAAFANSLPHTLPHVAAMQWCIAAAAVNLGVAFPPLARLLARAFVREAQPSHTARLTASIALVALLLPVPFQLLSDDLLDLVTSAGGPLVDVGALVGQLIGELLFALAAVGLWVSRDLSAVRERLGLGRMTAKHALVAAVGLALVIGGNAGMEWIERTHFHALWLRDQDMVRMIAGDISLGTALVLGISAGVGEEVLVRGALQPRVGLFWASLMFTAGHVQYTWFGMLTIAVLGVLLGLVRQRSNTTTAIVVHVLYDVFAALGSR